MHTQNTTAPLQPDPTHNDLYPVELLFLTRYIPWDHPCSYIQHVRERKVYVYEYADAELRGKIRQQETDYFAQLETLRRSFADETCNAIPLVDLIVDPPSNSHLHRPYLAAIRDRLPDVGSVCFVKHKAISSSGKGCTVDDLYRTMQPRAHEEVDVRLKDKRRVLIVDDAFASGKTAAAVIRHLKPRMSEAETQFIVACPLLVENK